MMSYNDSRLHLSTLSLSPLLTLIVDNLNYVVSLNSPRFIPTTLLLFPIYTASCADTVGNLGQSLRSKQSQPAIFNFKIFGGKYFEPILDFKCQRCRPKLNRDPNLGNLMEIKLNLLDSTMD